MSSAHGGIIHNQNTSGCKILVPSIFGNLFNLLSVVLCLCCFIQSGKTHILFTIFPLVIHNSDLRRNISCTKVEKQRDRRGPQCSSGKVLEKWKTHILIPCHSKTVFLTFQKLHSRFFYYSVIPRLFYSSEFQLRTPKWHLVKNTNTLSLNSDHLILAFGLFKADFLRKLLLYTDSVTHCFRNQSHGTSYELDQKSNRPCVSMTQQT